MLVREIKEYKNAYHIQQISLLETITEFFTLSNPRHDPKVYKQTAQRYLQGEPVDISVFHAGELKECRIARST